MSSETINAIREAAREQRHVPAVRRELASDPALERVAAGSDTYRWRESAKHTRLERAAKRRGIGVEELLDDLVLSGLRALRALDDGMVRTSDIALSKGLRSSEVEPALRRLEARGQVHFGHCAHYKTRDAQGKPVISWGWKLGTPELTVTVAEALGVEQ